MSVSLINGHIDPDKSKMTPQEAIEWLKAVKEKYIHGGDENFDNKRKTAISAAIETLEKQIPKKPETLNYIPLLNSGWKHQCPNCGCAVGTNKNLEFAYEEYLEPYQSNCMSCGQALDWSDIE